MKKLISVIVIVLGLSLGVFGVPHNAQASAPVTIWPSLFDDTHVSTASPNSSYGDQRFLTLSNGVSGFSPVYIKHNMPTIPAGATINSATLTLSYNMGIVNRCSGAPTPNSATVYQVMGDWHEETLTWNNKPASGTQVSGSLSCDSTTTKVTFDVKSIVTNWKNGAFPYGFAIYGPGNGSWTRDFYSKEEQASKMPLLTIIYTVPDAPSSGNTGSQVTGISGTTATTPSGTSTAAVAPVDTSVKAPGLDRVLGDGANLPVENGRVDISFDDYISIVGSGASGQKIVVWVAGNTYETSVNSLGYWAITIDSRNLKEADYAVEAQAQSGSKGSTKETLVTLKKTDLEKLARELSKGSEGLSWLDRAGMVWFTVGPILSFLFWIFVIVLIVVLVSRHNKKKKAKLTENSPIAPAAIPAPVKTAEPSPETPVKPETTKNTDKNFKTKKQK